MAATIDQTIEQKQQSWLSAKLSSQTFWVLIAVILACVFLSFATDSFATTKNLYNITRNVTFVAIIARSLAMVASGNTVVYQFGPDHDKLLALGGGAWLFHIANPVLYMIVLALITGFVLRWTKFGRHVFAIGGNEQAAVLTGIPVRP